MFEKHAAHPTPLCAVSWRASSLIVVAALVLLTGACEDKGIGRSCSLAETPPADEGAYSVDATDCQTRMCVRPAIQPGVLRDNVDTGAYCSAACVSDGDCQGQTRDRSNPNDKRCKTGFTCAVPFGAADDTPGGGKLCCQKICLCRDFFSASVGPATPASCEAGAENSCSSVQRD
jgi:hypothetical protein